MASKSSGLYLSVVGGSLFLGFFAVRISLPVPISCEAQPYVRDGASIVGVGGPRPTIAQRLRTGKPQEAAKGSRKLGWYGNYQITGSMIAILEQV